MRRNRASTRARQSADAETLVKMARRLAESGSRLEDQLWQRRLIELINDRLARRSDDAIEAALDDLARTSQRAYDDLADLAESCAESTVVDIDGKPHDVLLLALPLLAWSRYKLPTTTLSEAFWTMCALSSAVTCWRATRESRWPITCTPSISCPRPSATCAA